MNLVRNKNIIFVLVFIAGIVVGGAGFYLSQIQDGLSQDKVGEVAINFVNKALAKENVTASLMSVAEESGVYKVHLKIKEKEYDSFISKDGKYLFSTAFNLEEEKAKEAEQLPQ